MGKECGTHSEHNNAHNIFWSGEAKRKKRILHLNVDVKITLKCFSEKHGVHIRTAFNRLRAASTGERL
jgi:hypothetical protein